MHHTPLVSRLTALALAAGLLLPAGPAAAELRKFPRTAPAQQANPAAAQAQIQVQPWSTLDFERISLGQARTLDVVVMTETETIPGLGGLGSLGGKGPQFPQMRIQGGAAGDYLLAEPLQPRKFQRVSDNGMPYRGWEWFTTIEFRPSAPGVRKSALRLDWEDGRSSGKNLVGMGVPPAGAVQMPRGIGSARGMVSLVGNPTTLGVSVLDLGLPKKVRMSPEPLSPNAAWETVFPISGKPDQPVTVFKAQAGGQISGANAADFALSANIAFQKGAPATRLITFSPRGSGLRTAEYSQLQFDGSTVTVVLEGYGK